MGVLDTAGNLITRFGRYGKQDSAGRGSAISIPDIPLGWAQAIAVNDEAVFIGDRLNQRVVRVNLEYTAEGRLRRSVSPNMSRKEESCIIFCSGSCFSS